MKTTQGRTGLWVDERLQQILEDLMHDTHLFLVIDLRHEIQKVLRIRRCLRLIFIEKLEDHVALHRAVFREKHGPSVTEKLLYKFCRDRYKRTAKIAGQFLRVQCIAVHKTAASRRIVITFALDKLIHPAFQYNCKLETVVLML